MNTNATASTRKFSSSSPPLNHHDHRTKEEKKKGHHPSQNKQILPMTNPTPKKSPVKLVFHRLTFTISPGIMSKREREKKSFAHLRQISAIGEIFCPGRDGRAAAIMRRQDRVKVILYADSNREFYGPLFSLS